MGCKLAEKWWLRTEEERMASKIHLRVYRLAHSPKIALHSHAGSNTWYMHEWNYISYLIVAIFHHAGDVWRYRDKKTVKRVDIPIFSLQKTPHLSIPPIPPLFKFSLFRFCLQRGDTTPLTWSHRIHLKWRGPVKIASISAHCGKNVFFRLSTGKKKFRRACSEVLKCLKGNSKRVTE